MDDDTISRKAAVNALWKVLYAYEDKTEKQFQESEDLDIYDWMVHRIYVQNMSDIDRRTILDLPSAQPHGRWIDPEDSTCYKCSVCGEYATQEHGLTKPIFWRYCPNCGAKMGVEE